ncbi:4Fe-4S single cluster domain-containing protein [Microbacterium sp. A93]|uniref:4Fe-4S single cluster domain-containing protein n=1 Tax=Microbacterium sp. A93 TaxID=3450716 RepID=UPI003F434A14
MINKTSAEGPGRRTALWVQGCSIRCRGCINPHLFSVSGGSLTSPAIVIESALAAGDEGLTLLGGEPLDQVEAVTNLARLAQDAGLGVICFTGYTMETIVASLPGKDLLRYVDLLIDGPYLAGAAEAERALVGSTNQRFIHLTDRYADYEPERTADQVELRILPTGEVSMAGFVTTQRLAELASALGARRSLKSSEHSSPRPI